MSCASSVRLVVVKSVFFEFGDEASVAIFEICGCARARSVLALEKSLGRPERRKEKGNPTELSCSRCKVACLGERVDGTMEILAVGILAHSHGTASGRHARTHSY